MRMKQNLFREIIFVSLLGLLIFLGGDALFSQDEDSAKREILEQKLAKKKKKLPEIKIKEMVEAEKPKPILPSEKTPLQKIHVGRVTFISEKKINRIIKPYKNRALTGAEMQECADLITRAYNRHGYITSYAYVKPENLNKGVLEIDVVEGRVGKIKVVNNRYFKTDLLKKKFGLKEGDPFNVNILKQNLYRINKSRDRKVRLKPYQSKKRGVIDLVLSVKDKSPMHLILDMDTYGSHYVLYKRYRTAFVHNNLTGRDDFLQLKAQMTESNAHKLYDLDYRIPLSNDLLFQYYLLPFKAEDYYEEREETDMEKRARKSYFYFYKSLIDKPNSSFTAKVGFIYMDILWYAYNQLVKEDRFRIISMGFDYVGTDDHGTTVVSDTLEFGIPRMWGGSAAKDPNTSVLGAGGKFIKKELIIARRQKLFWDIDLLLKTHGQICSHTVTGVNAFSVGGFFGLIDMRGYPRAQYFGDNGISLSTGFSFPPYFFPRDMKVPFSKAKLYKALKLFVFHDWAYAYKKSPKTAAEKASMPWMESTITDDVPEDTLQSRGCGFTLTLPEGWMARLDLGWPLGGNLPMDGKHFHHWFRVTKTF